MIITNFELIRQVLLDPLLPGLGLTLPLRREAQNLWHVNPVRCGAEHSRRSASPDSHAVDLATVDLEKVCFACVYDHLHEVAAFLLPLMEAEICLGASTDPDLVDNLTNVQEMEDSFFDALDRLRFYAAHEDVGAYRDRIEQIDDCKSVFTSNILAAKKSDRNRLTIRIQIATEIIPPQWQGRVPLEEDMVLIGLTPFRKGFHDFATSAVEAYQIFREGDTYVALAPRYVYTYLMLSRDGDRRVSVLVDCTPAPDSEDVCDSAARLWAPNEDGALSSLAAAVAAAKEV